MDPLFYETEEELRRVASGHCRWGMETSGLPLVCTCRVCRARMYLEEREQKPTPNGDADNGC